MTPGFNVRWMTWPAKSPQPSQQGARLARLLPNAARVVFADSGHTLLLEDDFDLAAVMDCHGRAVQFGFGTQSF